MPVWRRTGRTRWTAAAPSSRAPTWARMGRVPRGCRHGGGLAELAVKERQLLALANVDADLCARVAQGLGLAAPEQTEDVVEREPSPVLSQLGGT